VISIAKRKFEAIKYKKTRKWAISLYYFEKSCCIIVLYIE